MKRALRAPDVWFLNVPITENVLLIGIVFAPNGFSTKLSQTWWLETIDIYSLTDLDARSPKPESSDWNQGVGRATLPSVAIGENPFIASSCFWWLLTFLGLWPHHSNLQGQHLQIFFYSFFPLVFLFLSPLCVWNLPLPVSIRTLVTAFRTHWII